MWRYALPLLLSTACAHPPPATEPAVSSGLLISSSTYGGSPTGYEIRIFWNPRGDVRKETRGPGGKLVSLQLDLVDQPAIIELHPDKAEFAMVPACSLPLAVESRGSGRSEVMAAGCTASLPATGGRTSA